MAGIVANVELVVMQDNLLRCWPIRWHSGRSVPECGFRYGQIDQPERDCLLTCLAPPQRRTYDTTIPEKFNYTTNVGREVGEATLKSPYNVQIPASHRLATEVGCLFDNFYKLRR